jgi:hypothetical protein
MPDKFYQFHYAEMNGFELENLGILNCHFTKSVTMQDLKVYTRQILDKPNARILISHVTKLTPTEFEKLTANKTGAITITKKQNQSNIGEDLLILLQISSNP